MRRSMKRVISADVVAAEHQAGRRRIAAPRASTVITPDAWSRARELGVTLDDGKRTPSGPEPRRHSSKPAPAAEKGSCERVVDPAGVVVVRGRSVRLGAF